MFRLAVRAITREHVMRPVAAQAVRSAAPSQGMLRPMGVRAFSDHLPWGDDLWRKDKNSFKLWCTQAMVPGTKAQRELYGFLAVAFGDVDANKDGLIGIEEFDLLCEKVAALPRRFGMAPSWEAEYQGDLEARKEARKAMFVALDIRNGPPRNALGLKQFIRWARDHILRKVPTLDLKSKVDFAHLGEYDEATFVDYLEYALENPESGAHATLYEFLLTMYVEADVNCGATIDRKEFDLLVDRAVAVPRTFGLAPMTTTKEGRDKVFNSMDDNGSGFITFRKFLAWTIAHSTEKIKLHREGKGYKKPS
jgi:hypothetical protein